MVSTPNPRKHSLFCTEDPKKTLNRPKSMRKIACVHSQDFQLSHHYAQSRKVYQPILDQLQSLYDWLRLKSIIHSLHEGFHCFYDHQETTHHSGFPRPIFYQYYLEYVGNQKCPKELFAH
jgi:hypothetical protein